MPTEYTVAGLLAETLHHIGLNRLYGIIGTSVIDFIDTLYNYRDKIDFVTTRHEQVAASAADAQGRVTGKPGVAVVHAGPGFLNAMISLGIAYRDRAPLLLISGGVRRRLRKTGAWLEVDQESLSRPIAKSYYYLGDPSSTPETLVSAVKDALTPPRGPVVLEVAEDIWRSKINVADSYFKRIKDEISSIYEKGYGQSQVEDFVKDVLNLLETAEKPVILACGELSMDPRFKQSTLLKLASKIGAYIVTSGNGRGACPEDHPRCLGRVGFGGGSLVADRAFENSDLVIVLGNEFDDITTYAYTMLPEGDILVASLDPLVEKRPAYYDYYIVDPIIALEKLVDSLESHSLTPKDKLDELVSEARKQWNTILGEALNRSYDHGPNPALFFKELDRVLPRDRIIAAGQGTHILYTYSYMKIYEPRSFLAATNLGAMSYAFPAAIGAAQATTNRPVIAVVGDGDFMMTVQDLETVVREKIPVKIIVVNDNSYKVLYLRQTIQLGGRIYETLLGNPDFMKLAEAFGIKGIRVENNNMIASTIEEILRSDDPLLVEIPVSPDDLPPLNLEYTLRMSS